MNSYEKNTIYPHAEATAIVEMFDDLLCNYGIKVPSPEDNEREEDNGASLYGSVYAGLLDAVEAQLLDMLDRCKSGSQIIENVYPYGGF